MCIWPGRWCVAWKWRAEKTAGLDAVVGVRHGAGVRGPWCCMRKGIRSQHWASKSLAAFPSGVAHPLSRPTCSSLPPSLRSSLLSLPSRTRPSTPRECSSLPASLFKPTDMLAGLRLSSASRFRLPGLRPDPRSSLGQWMHHLIRHSTNIRTASFRVANRVPPRS
jgi:hypothetical protein